MLNASGVIVRACSPGELAFEWKEGDPRAPDGRFGEGGDTAAEPFRFAPDDPRVDLGPSPQLENAAAQWRAGLSTEEQSAILNYTSRGGYGPINDVLRSGDPLTPEQSAMIGHLDAAIARAGELPEPTTVFRGIDMGPVASTDPFESRQQTEARTREGIGKWAAETFPVGGTVELGGFQSTSFDTAPALDASLSRDSPGVIFEIEAHAGAYLGGSSDLTRFDDEHELLLPRDTTYEVTGVLPNATFEDLEGGTRDRTIVQLRQT